MIEKEIVNTLVKLRVNVDKDELIKALEYDRKQYEKGYADAIADGAMVVRCKDCEHGVLDDGFPHQYFCVFKGDEWNNADYFCGHAKKKEVTT